METKVLEMHEIVKEMVEVKKRVAEILDRSDRNDLVTFMQSPVSIYDEYPEVEVHVFSGIQHLAKFFNKEIAITRREGFEIYDLKISFIKDGVRYYQIETSEVWERILKQDE